VQKWFVGDVPFYVNIWQKLTHSFQKTPISDQYSLVALQPLTPSEKVQFTRIAEEVAFQ